MNNDSTTSGDAASGGTRRFGRFGSRLLVLSLSGVGWMATGCSSPQPSSSVDATTTPDTVAVDSAAADTGGPEDTGSALDTATQTDSAPTSDAAADTAVADAVDASIPTTPLHPVAPCKLVPTPPGSLGLGFPRSDKRLRSTGVVRAKVLFVDFPDAAATTPTQTLAEILAPTAADFFAGASYGAMTLAFDFHSTWLRMSKPSTEYAAAIKTYQGHRDWLQEAVTLADDAVDFSDGDVVVLIATPAAKAISYGPTWMGVGGASGSLVADGAAITNGVTSGTDLLSWGGIWLNHELGHSLGLPDLYDFNSSGGFTRPFSLMDLISSEAPGYFAYSRWLLGWISDPQVVCLSASEQVALAPIEAKGGLKLAVVPLSSTRAVVVESRRATGLDKALKREGAVVYTVDTTVASGHGPVQVHNDRKALLAGESVTVEGVTIALLSSDGAGDTIVVTTP